MKQYLVKYLMQLSKDDSMSQAYMASSDDLICVNDNFHLPKVESTLFFSRAFVKSQMVEKLDCTLQPVFEKQMSVLTDGALKKAPHALETK